MIGGAGLGTQWREQPWVRIRLTTLFFFTFWDKKYFILTTTSSLGVSDFDTDADEISAMKN